MWLHLELSLLEMLQQNYRIGLILVFQTTWFYEDQFLGIRVLDQSNNLQHFCSRDYEKKIRFISFINVYYIIDIKSFEGS